VATVLDAAKDYVIADLGLADFGRRKSPLPKPKCPA
jgi:hypothetical protein